MRSRRPRGLRPLASRRARASHRGGVLHLKGSRVPIHPRLLSAAAGAGRHAAPGYQPPSSPDTERAARAASLGLAKSAMRWRSGIAFADCRQPKRVAAGSAACLAGVRHGRLICAGRAALQALRGRRRRAGALLRGRPAGRPDERALPGSKRRPCCRAGRSGGAHEAPGARGAPGGRRGGVLLQHERAGRIHHQRDRRRRARARLAGDRGGVHCRAARAAVRRQGRAAGDQRGGGWAARLPALLRAEHAACPCLQNCNRGRQMSCHTPIIA